MIKYNFICSLEAKPKGLHKKKEIIMKKFLAIVLALVMVLGLAACGNSSTGTATTTPTDTKVIFTQGFDLDFPPYTYLGDDGNYTGFDVELCQAVCDYLGWEYAGFPVNWDAKDAELNSGSCDCIWSGFTINGREDLYTWSIPYSNNEQMILVPEGSDIKTLDDLAGKVVGVQMSTSADDMLADARADLTATFKELKEYETYTIAFTDLKAGGCDALAIDVTTGNFQMEQNKDFPCVYLAEMLGNEQYGVGFRLGDTELCNQVNNALKALAKDGTVDKIAAKYPEITDYISIAY